MLRATEDAAAHQFIERCRALKDGVWLYPYYRLLSTYSHGGTTLNDLYVREVDRTDEAPLGIAFEPRAAFDVAELVVGVQAIALHMALTAWDKLAVGHPLATQLAEVGERMGTRSDIAPRD